MKRMSDRAIIVWAHFWYWGVYALGFLLILFMVGFGKLIGMESQLYYSCALSMFPFSMLVDGIFIFIGSLRSSVIVSCISQAAHHQKMNLYYADMTKEDKREMVGVAITFSLLGLAGVLVFIFL